MSLIATSDSIVLNKVINYSDELA